MPADKSLLSVAEVLKLPVNALVTPGFTAAVEDIVYTWTRETGSPMHIFTLRDLDVDQEISMTLFQRDCPFVKGSLLEITGFIRRSDFRGLQQVTVNSDTIIKAVNKPAEPAVAPDPVPAAKLPPASERMVEIAVEAAVNILIKNSGSMVFKDSIPEDIYDIASKILSGARRISAEENTP